MEVDEVVGGEPRSLGDAIERVEDLLRLLEEPLGGVTLGLFPRLATSTPAETRSATILRSARFSTASMQVGQVNR